MTDAVKDRVLGLNAAELFGLDPNATRCVLAADMLEGSRPVQRELAANGDLPRADHPVVRCLELQPPARQSTAAA